VRGRATSNRAEATQSTFSLITEIIQNVKALSIRHTVHTVCIPIISRKQTKGYLIVAREGPGHGEAAHLELRVDTRRAAALARRAEAAARQARRTALQAHLAVRAAAADLPGTPKTQIHAAS